MRPVTASVKTALLDLNILTALLWPAHEHHEAAHRWFGARRKGRWATCAITELGLIRLITNPLFSRDALSPADALVLLSSNLAHETHDFWLLRWTQKGPPFGGPFCERNYFGAGFSKIFGSTVGLISIVVSLPLPVCWPAVVAVKADGMLMPLADFHSV